MSINIFTLTSFCALILMSCTKQKSTNETLILQKFSEWKSEQLNKGLLWDKCPPIDQVPRDKRWCISQGYNCQFDDINGDSLIDGFITFYPDDCLHGSAHAEQQAILIISKKNQGYYIDTSIISSIKRVIAQDILNNLKFKRFEFAFKEMNCHNPYFEIKGECFIYSDDDANCCPSYGADFIYSINNQNIEINYFLNEQNESHDVTIKTILRSKILEVK